QRAALGPMLGGERVVAVVFMLTALAWILRDPKSLGPLTVPGITTWLPRVTDSTIALAGALILFRIPVRTAEGRREPAMNWEWAIRVPWGVLLLFGGGLSLARGFETSGLAIWIGDQVANLEMLPALGLIAAVAILF